MLRHFRLRSLVSGPVATDSYIQSWAGVAFQSTAAANQQTAEHVDVSVAEKSRPTVNWLLEARKAAHAGFPDKVRNILDVERRKSLGTRNKELSVDHYNTLIEAYSRQSNFEEMRNVVALMERRGVEPNAKTFGSFIWAHTAQCEAQAAEQVLNNMENEGLEVRPMWRALVIKAYAASGDFDKANALVSEIEKQGFVDGNKSALRQAYNSLLSVYATRGMESEVLSLVEKMNREGIYLDAVTYFHLVRAYGNSPESIEKVPALLKEMQKKGFAISGQVYNAYIRGLLRHGKVDEAERIVEKMVEEKMRVDIRTITNIIRYHAEKKNVSLAEDLFQRTGKDFEKANIVTIDTMLSMYSKTGMHEKAKSLFSDLEKFNVKPNRIVFETMIEMYARMGAVEESKRFLKQMRKAGFSPRIRIYVELIKMYEMKGDLNMAQNMVKAAKRQGLALNAEAYSSLLRLAKSTTNLTEGQVLFEKTLEEVSERFDLSDEERIVASGTWGTNIRAYNEMAKLFLEKRMFDDVVLLLQEIRRHGLQPDEETTETILESCKLHANLGLAKALLFVLKHDRRVDQKEVQKVEDAVKEISEV